MTEQTTIISGLELGDTICKALKIDPMSVERVIVDCHAGRPGPARVYVQMCASKEVLWLDWPNVLDEEGVRVLDREER